MRLSPARIKISLRFFGLSLPEKTARRKLTVLYCRRENQTSIKNFALQEGDTYRLQWKRAKGQPWSLNRLIIIGESETPYLVKRKENGNLE